MVLYFACRISSGVRISPREASFLTPATLCWLFCITRSAVFEPWSHVETASRSQVVAEVCACVNQAADRLRTVTD